MRQFGGGGDGESQSRVAVAEEGGLKERWWELDFEWVVVGLCPAMRRSDTVRHTDPAKNRCNWNVGNEQGNVRWYYM